MFNCIHPDLVFSFSTVFKKTEDFTKLSEAFFVGFLFPFLKSSEEKQKNKIKKSGISTGFLSFFGIHSYFLKKEIIHTLHMAIIKQK